MILDYSAQRIPSSPKVKMVGGKPVLFAPGDVTALMIHQTDCFFGSENQTPEWCAKRALKVAAHITVFRTGLVAVSAPLDWVMNHGNAPNIFSWGIEVEGCYKGYPADTRPRNFKPLNRETEEGIRLAICLLVAEAAKRGHKLTTVLSHRQSSETRRADPGYEIWPGAEACAMNHGILAAPTQTWAKGRPVPEVWDFIQKGAAY
jgi:hypothetical protein